MISFILNTPYTLVGLLLGIISTPHKFSFVKKPYAFVIEVKNLWWLFGYMKGGRALVVGHVVMLGPNIEEKDLEHELVHVEQYARAPIVHPFLYYVELFRKGYKNNKYEIEAYSSTGSVYRGKS
ncbi:MAG: hypothetical protein KBC21_02900 [Candidatus Pacebacteria bacterium]|nr:hypothetical protein [Candidatus Paceibacterota bacterium]